MIREATREDVMDIIELSRGFAGEVGFSDYYSTHSASTLITHMISDGILLVSERDGYVVGVMGGTISGSPWNKSVKVLEEQIFYVKPEYRNTTVGLRLFKEYCKVSEGIDAKFKTLKLMFNSPDLDKHYKKAGYNPLETTFIKEE